jgi:hypothetical protein
LAKDCFAKNRTPQSVLVEVSWAVNPIKKAQYVLAQNDMKKKGRTAMRQLLIFPAQKSPNPHTQHYYRCTYKEATCHLLAFQNGGNNDRRDGKK